MAGQADYKHITVNPADEEDVVIHAGARSEAEKPRTEAPVADAAPSDGPSSPRRDDAEGYRATTLEDIEGSKMPKTQVVVIVLAVLAIAAFVVWYTVFS